MSGLIGKKIGMTSIFNEQGLNIPCTVIEAGPCVVTQVKDKNKDGYDAVQLGFLEKKDKNLTKAEKGHFKKGGVDPKAVLMEFKNFDDAKNGDIKDLSIFSEGEWVDVSAKSKGKGFQGVVKRHGFKGVGESTHGQHNRLRAPGSIGACSTPSRVFKGLRMAGQTGNKKALIENLEIVKIFSEKNLLLVKGAIPGAKGSIVKIEKWN